MIKLCLFSFSIHCTKIIVIINKKRIPRTLRSRRVDYMLQIGQERDLRVQQGKLNREEVKMVGSLSERFTVTVS